MNALNEIYRVQFLEEQRRILKFKGQGKLPWKGYHTSSKEKGQD
jgi:hypothetical protein